MSDKTKEIVAGASAALALTILIAAVVIAIEFLPHK
jgi:hypothetical protein